MLTQQLYKPFDPIISRSVIGPVLLSNATDYRHVVIVRNMFESIVSGFLYHKSGHECWLSFNGQKNGHEKNSTGNETSPIRPTIHPAIGGPFVAIWPKRSRKLPCVSLALSEYGGQGPRPSQSAMSKAPRQQHSSSSIVTIVTLNPIVTYHADYGRWALSCPNWHGPATHCVSHINRCNHDGNGGRQGRP